jgi:hypothetical protein
MAAKDFEETNPWLFSVFIKYDAFDDNDEKMAEFFELKESLIIAMEYKNTSYYIGNRVIDNWSEIYFCAEDSKGLEAIANSILKSSGYIYECNVVKDAKWEFYDFNIFPTELEMAVMQSYQIMAMLEDEGDNLSTCREVEHYASFDTASQKDRFVEAAKEKGFEYKDDLSDEDFTHGVAVVKEHDLAQDTIIHIISDIFSLVDSNGGSYELWSTVIQEEE